MTDLITAEILKKWDAREDGVELFIKHFPDGATLQEISDKCIEINEDNNAIWVFNKCRELKIFEETTAIGYRNSGNRNSGNWNSGNRNSGNWNSGDGNSGNWNSGNWNSGDGNSGNWNSGNWNSGNRNSGNWNSGNRNSGNWNSGNWNSGDGNSGNWNSGNWNSGYKNSGDGNSGNWNSCNREAGFFNSEQPDSIRVFNKPCSLDLWERATKPDFIHNINLTYWVPEWEMTEEDKKADPDSYVRGGQLRKRDYKEAWKIAFESATERDIELLKALPNFDAVVFEEITGIKID